MDSPEEVKFPEFYLTEDENTVLRLLGGMVDTGLSYSVSEIAKVLRVSESWVEQRRDAGIQKLKNSVILLRILLNRVREKHGDSEDPMMKHLYSQEDKGERLDN